jgi:phosphopantothenoylcysteine decarboxylase / phosphopantothenate---cysteine ligase
MKVLITAGPTYEPIDAVRFIGNRSSGQMGAALAAAALNHGHELTLILGPVTAAMPTQAKRIDVETARQMHDAVLEHFPAHDLLIMAAAVADFRPKPLQTRNSQPATSNYQPATSNSTKLERTGTLTLELEATEDIAAAAGQIKRPDQRTIGFSLVPRGDMDRTRQKLIRKNLDLIVYNPLDTMSSQNIESILLYPDGRTEELPCRPKKEFADTLIRRASALFTSGETNA